MDKIIVSKKGNIINLMVSTILFILVGVLQFFDDCVDKIVIKELMNFTAHLILISLSVFWVLRIHNRITTKYLQKVIVCLAIFIVMFLLLRFIKYKFFKTNDIVMRYLWYAYYIPQTAIPVLMLSAACYVGYDEKKGPIKWLKYLIIPAAIMIILIMTNDIHQLAFSFKPDFLNWDSDYKHQLLYWCNIVWQLVLTFISVGIIFRKCRIEYKNKIKMMIIGCGICVALIILSFFSIISSYKIPELFCLFYVFILEYSIQVGLIPSNSYYPRYFALSNISALIVDNNDNVVFKSEKDNFSTINNVSYENKTTLMNNMKINAQKISGGKIIWMEDLTSINEMNEKLKDVQKNLNEETELIFAENELKEQQFKIIETQKIYSKIENAVYKQVTEIEEIVSNTTTKDKDYTLRMIKVGILGAYVKRRSNLTFIAEMDKMLSFDEVGLCIKESLGYLEIGGVHCAFMCDCNCEISTEDGLSLFDAYEYVIENVMEVITDLTVHLGIENECIVLRFVIEGKKKQAINNNPYADMTITVEDDSIFVRLQLPKKVII